MGVNADTIGMICLVDLIIRNMQFGIKQKNGARVGKYTFEGQKFSLKQLVLLEQDEVIMSNPERKAAFYTLLHTLKEEFKSIVQPSLQTARSTKKMSLELVKEWANKAQRTDTFLLKWSEAAYGQEFKLMDEQIVTFAGLNQLCDDLRHFQNAMIRSCPNAKRLFVERAQKCKKIAQLLGELDTVSRNEHDLFMRHAKKNLVDSVTLQALTTQSVRSMLTAYQRTAPKAA